MSSTIKSRILVLPAFAALAGLVLAAHGATAQSATGTVAGRVVWGPCIRGIPLPAAPDAQQGAPTAPDAQVMPQPMPVPAPANGLPAGAVLVAVQNTNISARTDETGKFSLSGVPAGQYMTVAAGPVANAALATAERPNVFVSGGQTVDLGTLSLGGGSTPFGIACRILPGVGAAAPADNSQPGTDMPQPGPEAPPTSP